MAVMIGYAVDWTYDFFVEDAGLYKATPIKGVHCGKDASDREQFMVWLKNSVRDFKAKWAETCPYQYDNYYGWIGDAFAGELWGMGFSDYYKDTYGQRPHLDTWFYVNALGLPMTGDVGRTFCATPIEDAIEMARRVRKEVA